MFALIAQEYQGRGLALPKDTTEIVHASRDCPPLFFKILRQLGVSQEQFDRLR